MSTKQRSLALRVMFRTTVHDQKVLAGEGRLEWEGCIEFAFVPILFAASSTRCRGSCSYDMSCGRVVYAQKLSVVALPHIRKKLFT